ncbi:MAG: transcription antitermination factor NusB [Pseudomonadota bacterium]
MQARTNARLAAVQALYQMEAAGAGVESVIVEFRAHRLGGDIEGRLLHEADDEFFADLVRGVVRMQTKIDPLIQRNLADKWTLARLDATVRAILRSAAYELFHRRELSPRAIIDEYLEIANAFFDEDERKFVNAVLDALWRERRDEDGAKRPRARAKRT